MTSQLSLSPRKRRRWLAGLLLCVMWTQILPAAPFAYASSDLNIVSIDLATETIDTIISMGVFSNANAITPDGATAYACILNGEAVVPVDLSTNTPGSPIPVGHDPASIAITPDGTMAYVCNSTDNTVTPITIATNSAGTPIPVGGFPEAIAVTPSGTTAYVCNNTDGTVTPITLATHTAGTPIVVGDGPQGIAITPDGAMAYVCNVHDGTVTPITLATHTVGTAISVGASPLAIAITPDGTMAYVCNAFDTTVTPITLATHATGTPINLPGPPQAIAITPKGTRAYVFEVSGGGFVIMPIDLTTDTLGTPIAPGTSTASLVGLSITPDQAPTSLFTASISNLIVSFDGSSSSSPVGSIARYDWDFGDGHTGSSRFPTIGHIYGGAGTFTVTLTVTNTSGTSTRQTFTGQTVSNNGLPCAQSTQAITVSGHVDATWEAILGSSNAWAVPLAIPSYVLGDNVRIQSGTFMGTAITPDRSKALIACIPEVVVLDLTQPIITVTSVTGFTQAAGVAITPDGTRALVSDSSTNAVAVLNLLSSPITIESWISSVGLGPMGVAITPRGDKALVALNGDPNYLAAVSTSARR